MQKHESLPRKQVLERYVTQGLDRIEGWLTPYSARFIADLMAVQQALGIGGSFGEIGVHHGKLFILLRLAAAGGPGFAVDVFEDQHLNVDSSGMGSRAHFEARLATWSCPGDGAVTIFKRSSLEMIPAEILAAAGPCRIISIDGGHTEECALSDLQLAEGVLHADGVAALDDVFNEEWPDVATGLARYCLDSSTRLRPFAICPNKVFLAQADRHAKLLTALKERHGRHVVRHNRMFGHEVWIFRSCDVAPSVEALDEMQSYVLRYPGKVLRHVVSRSPIGPTAIRMRDLARALVRS